MEKCYENCLRNYEKLQTSENQTLLFENHIPSKFLIKTALYKLQLRLAKAISKPSVDTYGFWT